VVEIIDLGLQVCKAYNQLQQYYGYQWGKVYHTSPGNYTAQGRQKWFGKLVENDSQPISRTWRKPGQDSPKNNGYGEHLAYNPDKVKEKQHCCLIPQPSGFIMGSNNRPQNQVGESPFFQLEQSFSRGATGRGNHSS